MLSTLERVLFLKAADIFGAISGEDLAPVAMVAQEVCFSAGETFIQQGEPGDCLYAIVDGEASLIVHGVGQVATRGPRSVIGEMAVISGRPRTAQCVAITDITALKVDRDDFWELLGERPALALGVIKVLAERFDEAVRNMAGPGHS